MKPKKLVISAFGPYLERTEIDFSVFDNSGLYLVTGDTGAGKSTIFEAICYALYGETVSGGDRSARMLRNKRAEDKDETYIELEMTSNGKNYYIRRSPAYTLTALKRSRKKKDEEDKPDVGDFKEHTATFLLRCFDENIDYTRERDAQDKINEIVGISKTNFKRISMIAQGEFMSIIREKTDSRERILNSVFGTQKYGLLMEKLKEYNSSAKNEFELIEKELKNDLKNISCRTDSPYYQETNRKKEVEYISAAELESLAQLIDNIMHEDKKSEEAVDKLMDENSEKRTKLNRKIEKAENRAKLVGKLKEKNEELEKNKKGLPVLQENLHIAEGEKETGERLKTQAELLRSKLPEYQRLSRLTGTFMEFSAQAKKAEKDYSAAVLEKKKKDEKIELLVKQNSQLDGIEEEKSKLDLELGSIIEYGKRIRSLQTMFKQLDDSTAVYVQKLKKYESDKKLYELASRKYEELNRAFLDDQAGLLAMTLEDNKPCPVCGSLTHPSPAAVKGSAPDKSEVEQAKADRDHCLEKMNSSSAAAAAEKGSQNKLKEQICEMISELFEKTVAPEDAAKMRDYTEKILNEKLNEASQLKKKIENLEKHITNKKENAAALDRLRREKDQLDSRLRDLTALISEKKTAANAAEENILEIRSKLELPDEEQAKQHIEKLSQQYRQISAQYERARQALENGKKIIAAFQSEAELLTNQIKENDVPEQEILNEKARELSEQFKELEEKIKEINVRMQLNKKARKTIESKSEEYILAKKKLQCCNDLYSTSTGRIGGDKVKLDSYVLWEYFDRILVLANNRMMMMTDGRYQLVRSEIAADKRKTFGLELDILDSESGKRRSVSTLSGGESFMAALALSLGLSDEIQSASGGIKLETMFIDEGFGSLDDKSLEKAVESLTALGSGDCLIGIISHVGQLKEMITKRIVISRNSAGSTTASVEI